jgi:uncharacterized cupin superfamily protein
MSICGRTRYDHTYMASDNLIEFGTPAVSLGPLPIRAHWILEGAPLAKCTILSKSTDGTAKTIVWDCTAGRFNWYYDMDETVYVLEGSVLIKDRSGATRRVEAGETIFFRAGSHAEWTVDRYIRKLAFLRAPVPPFAMLAIRAIRLFRRLAKFEWRKPDTPDVF